MTDSARRCGQCDGCLWGGHCMRLLKLSPTALTGNGTMWALTGDGWVEVTAPEPPQSVQEAPGRPRPMRVEATSTETPAVPVGEVPLTTPVAIDRPGELSTDDLKRLVMRLAKRVAMKRNP